MEAEGRWVNEGGPDTSREGLRKSAAHMLRTAKKNERTSDENLLAHARILRGIAASLKTSAEKINWGIKTIRGIRRGNFLIRPSRHFRS